MSNSLLKTISSASIPLLISLIILLFTAPILLTQFPSEHFLDLSILIGIAGIFSIIDFGLGRSYVTSLAGRDKEEQLPYAFGVFFQLSIYLFVSLVLLYLCLPSINLNENLSFFITNSHLLVLLLFLSVYLSLFRSMLECNSLFMESNTVRALIQTSLAISPLLAMSSDQPVQDTLYYIIIGRVLLLAFICLAIIRHKKNVSFDRGKLKFINIKLSLSHFSIIIFISFFGLLDRYFATILLDSVDSNLYAKIFEGISRTTLLAAVFSSYFLTNFCSVKYSNKKNDFYIFVFSICVLYSIIASILYLMIFLEVLEFGEIIAPIYIMLISACLISLAHYPNSYFLSKKIRYYLIYIYIFEIAVIILVYKYFIVDITLYTFVFLFLLRSLLDCILQYSIYFLVLSNDKKILYKP